MKLYARKSNQPTIQNTSGLRWPDSETNRETDGDLRVKTLLLRAGIRQPYAGGNKKVGQVLWPSKAGNRELFSNSRQSNVREKYEIPLRLLPRGLAAGKRKEVLHSKVSLARSRRASRNYLLEAFLLASLLFFVGNLLTFLKQ